MSVDWGELGDAGKALVKKVFKEDPVKKAKDDAEVSEIRLKSEINRREILNDLIEKERKKLENREAITTKALSHLNENAKPDKIDPDWIANFFDKHCLVSNEQAQDLLARILAGEANSPGKISKRTVNLLADFDQQDAEFFLALTSFVRKINELFVPLIYDSGNAIYRDNGVNFGRLIHLDSIGLLQFDSINGFILTGRPEKIIVEYDNKEMLLVLAKSGHSDFKDYIVNIGSACFTHSGLELLSIVKKQGIVKIPEFDEYIRSQWEKLGYKLEVIPN